MQRFEQKHEVHKTGLTDRGTLFLNLNLVLATNCLIKWFHPPQLLSICSAIDKMLYWWYLCTTFLVWHLTRRLWVTSALIIVMALCCSYCLLWKCWTVYVTRGVKIGFTFAWLYNFKFYWIVKCVCLCENKNAKLKNKPVEWLEEFVLKHKSQFCEQ